jgi:D-sedoheptulose 7-phosphate isomerase
MFQMRLEHLQEVLHQCSYETAGEKIHANKALRLVHSLLLSVKKNKGIAYVIGNGGSAGIASHFAVDLINALKIASNTLYDSNLMTCIGNDYGYDQIFSSPLKILLQPADLLVAISSSGASKNILNAVEVAKEKQVKVITLSGFLPNNPLRSLGDLNFWLDRRDYGLVEMGHFFLLHTIIDAWKNDFFGLKSNTHTSKDAAKN